MEFWNPQVHYIATLIHVFAAVFWLGWMVFLFLILRPVMARMEGIKPSEIMGPIRKKVRKIVFWLIPAILLTGLYNMGYRGLFNWELLTGSAYGQQMLIKLGAATVLFLIYYLAPVITGGKLKHKGQDCHSNAAPHAMTKKISVIMHLVAFTSGVIAAYIGIMMGG